MLEKCKPDDEHSGQCGKCDGDNFEYLNYIDPSDSWGFCDPCWEEIERTGKV